jgi:hypothetical protein
MALATQDATDIARDLTGETPLLGVVTVRELVFQQLGVPPDSPFYSAAYGTSRSMSWLEPNFLNTVLVGVFGQTLAAVLSGNQALGTYFTNVAHLLNNCELVLAPLCCSAHHVMAAICAREATVVVADSMFNNTFFTPARLMHALQNLIAPTLYAPAGCV